MNRITKILIVILLVIILLCTAFIGYKIWKNKTQDIASVETNVLNEEANVIEVEIKTVQTFKGNDRPIAVMIDNHKAALPQAGLNNAYLVYEIIVEGGESRLMALFKGQDLAKIGPVRSARHYFLDYALENDAIYVHFGWSPKAQSDISQLGVDNINFLTYSKGYERDTSLGLSREHTAFTSTDKIMKAADEFNYKKTSNKRVKT